MASTGLDTFSRINGALLLLPTVFLPALARPAQAATPPRPAQAGTTTIVVARGLTRDNSLVFRFDKQRKREPTTVVFEVIGASASSQQAAPSVRVANDLLSANPDGLLRASRVQTTAPVKDAGGTYTFMVDVELPPALRSWSGTAFSGAAFDGSLKIVAGDASATIPIRIRVRPSPWGPFGLLVLALVFGALMRWWAETGRPLRSQYDRYIRLLRFSGKQAEPNLRLAQDYLRAWDPVGAKIALDAIEEQLKAGTAAAPTGTATPSDPDTLRELLQARWKQRLLNFLIPGFIFLITSFAIAVYGFKSIYIDNPMFGAKGLGEWINLVGWGFAAGYAGKTINDYVGGKAGGALHSAT